MGFDYRLHPVQAEFSWLDQQIAVEKGAEEGSQQKERRGGPKGVDDGKAISIDKGSREPPAFSPKFRA